MTTVRLDSNSYVDQNPIQDQPSKDNFLKSVSFVFNNTLSELKKAPYRTLLTVAVIPIAAITNVNSLLIIPIGWVAYRVFRGVQLLFEKSDHAAIDRYNRIHKEIIDPAIINGIETSRDLVVLKQRFARAEGDFEGKITSISCISNNYVHLFVEVAEKQKTLKIFCKDFLLNQNDEHKLEDYRKIILVRIKEVQTAMSDAINKLPKVP